MRTASVLLPLALLGAPAPAQDEGLRARVDALFAPFDHPGSPGVALGVIRDGELIHARGYGMANLEHGVPNTPRTVFRIASTSKQFTALCMLLLERDGTVDLDEDIHRWFPELQDYGAPVTVRHLIHHTSGMRDYLTLMRLAGKRADDFYTDDDVLRMLARQKELNFPPGERFLYSNSGYFLLSQLVLRANGQTLSAFAEERVFAPLGMEHTHFHDDHTMVVPHRASGYSRRPDGMPRRSAQEPGGYRIAMTTLEMVGDGGVFTTVEDLLRWDRSFYGETLRDRQLVGAQLARGVLNDGTVLDYAAGLRVTEYRGLDVVRHGGSFVGFRAELLRFPTQRFSVICLANLAQTNPGRLAEQVAELYLGDRMEPTDTPRRPRPAVEPTRSAAEPPPPALAGDWAGTYHSPELDVVYTLTAGPAGAAVQIAALSPRPVRSAGTDRLTDGSNTLRLLRDDRGMVTGFLLDAGRVRNLRFERR